MRKAVLALIALASMPLAICSQQQPPPSPPPPPAVVAHFLEFSESQTDAFLSLLRDLQATGNGIAKQASEKHRELEALLNSDTPDPAAVGLAMIEIRAIQKQMGAAIQRYHEGFAGLLTEEQRRKVQAVTHAARLLPAVQAFVGLQLIPPPQ